MASSSGMRPAVGRLLRGHLSSSTRGSPAPLVPLWPPSRSTTRHRAGQTSPIVAAVASKPFSSSARLEARKTRDRSRLRGVSSLRRTGPKEFLSVTGEGIPRPSTAETAGRLAPSDVDPNHGLWDFFYNKELVPAPTDMAAHGRAWTVEELRAKSWDDLHALWWICVKERNRVATAMYALDKNKLGFGGHEAIARDDTVRLTMKNIKHALTERFYAWEDAVKLAKNDPEIDLSGEGPLYTPGSYLEEEDPSALEEPDADDAEAVAVGHETGEASKQEGDVAEKPKAGESLEEADSVAGAADPSGSKQPTSQEGTPDAPVETTVSPSPAKPGPETPKI